MSVSSKWFVSRIEGQTVHLYPVCRGIENREWASATPGGQMSMSITNAAALEQFVVGQEYEAIFRHVPKPAAGDGHQVQQLKMTSFAGTPAEKTVYVCGVCSQYARLNEDGTPNWTAHDEMFASQE